MKEHPAAANGVVEGNGFGMKGEPFEAVCVFAVFSVADNGVGAVGKVNADLVFSAGE